MNNRTLPIDKYVLYDLYVVKHMKIADISKIFHRAAETIVRDIKIYNIPLRKRGYGFNVKPEIVLEQNQLEFFDGLLAGDGSIVRRNSIVGKHTRGNDFISCAFKHEEFCKYIVNTIGLKAAVKYKIHKSSRYKSGQCGQYYFLSENNILFTKERDRWYIDGKKTLPDDFRFSPISMNILYLGDGFLAKGKSIYRSAQLCTNAFDKSNIEKIIVAGLKTAGITAYVGRNNVIIMNTENTIKFINYIGVCPVECYKYKWSV